MRCAVCDADGSSPYRDVEGVRYFRCPTCASLFAHPDFLARERIYADDYWANELNAARERCFGPALLRVAETIAYCRIPIHNFVDIGAGTGWLLDALEALMPEAIDRFHAVERFPPPQHTRNRNYVVGTLRDMRQTFDAGVCIEVIEHLAPSALCSLVAQLATVSHEGSLYLFNSGQPDFVEREDPGYLDPHGRGHIVCYSLAGAAHVFRPAGFNIIELPGRAWAFLAEYSPWQHVDAEALMARLWRPVPENVAMLKSARFGELIRTAGIESARAYGRQ